MLLHQLFFHIYVNESTNITLASGLRPFPQGTSIQYKKSVISTNYLLVQMRAVQVPQALMQAVRMGSGVDYLESPGFALCECMAF